MVKGQIRKHWLYEGFSYVEIVIVLAIIGIAATFLVPTSLSQLSGNRVKYHSNNIQSLIFTAQQDAYGQKGGSAHGVKFNADSFEIFEGSSYSESTASLTFNLDYSVKITQVNLINLETLTSTDEVYFERGSIFPSAVGTLQVSNGNQSYSVTINKEGLVYHEKI